VSLPILLEFIGFCALLRRAQIRVLRAVIHSRFRSVISTGDRLTRAFGAPAGLAVAIVEEDLASLRHHLFSERGTDTSGLLAQCCDLHGFALSLKPDSLPLFMSALETQALCKLAKRLDTEPSQMLQKRILALGNPPANLANTIATLQKPPMVTEVLDKVAKLSEDHSSSTQLAIECLAVSLGAVTFTQPGYRVWFDQWAQFRIGINSKLARKLAEAEAMIAFEFWSAICEAATGGPPPSDLLLQAFQGVSRERSRGELFASPYEQAMRMCREERG